MKKYEFRKGDKVICIDNLCVEHYLVLNNIYIVESDHDGVIILVGFENDFFAYRFILQKAIVEYL